MSAAGRLASAADYAREITANPSDQRYRRNFQALALELAPRERAVFDFGCGPGIDARCYAEHGLRVLAFDTDPAMCEYLAAHCREFLASGQISLQRGGYHEFLAGTCAAEERVGLITANFAPLNLIDDLGVLFGRFATLVAPGGSVLAGVLSPYYAGDARYRWWWRNGSQLRALGRYAVPGASSLIWRRTPQDFARQCAPHFTLAQVYAGNGRRVGARAPWLRLALFRYMFLLFRRTADEDSKAALQERATRRA